MSPQLQQLDAFTGLLLDPDCPPGDLLGAVQGLYDFLIEMTEWDSDLPDLDRETQLQHGRAISPRDAARCILDFRRTAGFLRAVDHAIREIRSRRPDRPVDLLYAGCGPLAPLVLPLAPRYTADELQITLLEIHEASLVSARVLFEKLGLRDRVRDFVNEDALGFGAGSNPSRDACVIEMLQMALENEPQLAVTARLAPQLVEDGILVPERITMEAAVADLFQEFEFGSADGNESEPPVPLRERVRVKLGQILELDRVSAPQLLAAATKDVESDRLILPGTVCEVPRALPANCRAPILRTTLHLSPGIVLDDYDSGLTVVRIVNSLGRVVPGEHLEFLYCLGTRPGFEVRRVV